MTGLTGPKGDKGDKGDTGASGATKLVVRMGSSTSIGFTYANAACLTGEVATGGGVFISSASSALRLSRPFADGWEGELQYSPTSQAIVVYAVCASP